MTIERLPTPSKYRMISTSFSKDQCRTYSFMFYLALFFLRRLFLFLSTFYYVLYSIFIAPSFLYVSLVLFGIMIFLFRFLVVLPINNILLVANSLFFRCAFFFILPTRPFTFNIFFISLLLLSVFYFYLNVFFFCSMNYNCYCLFSAFRCLLRCVLIRFLLICLHFYTVYVFPFIYDDIVFRFGIFSIKTLIISSFVLSSFCLLTSFNIYFLSFLIDNFLFSSDFVL